MYAAQLTSSSIDLAAI